MRATDIERAILTGRYPNRTEETRSMGITNIEMQTMKVLCDSLPRIAAAMEQIANALVLIEAQMPIDRERADNE
jgi:hypothetical protein